MNTKTLLATSLIALGAVGFAVPLVAHAEDTTTALKVIDTDNDGTIDLAEAKKAGMAIFKATDKDNDGTIDAKEGAAMMPADTDKDGTIDQAEYTKMIEAAFKKADPDNEGTVDQKELASPAAADLRAMIVPQG